jgi:hypothetical protein
MVAFLVNSAAKDDFTLAKQTIAGNSLKRYFSSNAVNILIK